MTTNRKQTGRHRRLIRMAIGALGLGLALTSCSLGTTAGSASPAPITSQVRFAPYVDVSAARPDLVQTAAATGAKNFVLAFALATKQGCVPAWGGVKPIQDAKLRAEADQLRKQGGDVIVASGGANAPYLENACTTPEALANAYGAMLDATGATHLDVDIEAPVPVDRVMAALSTVQNTRRVAITLTLPVAGGQQGLPPEGLNIVTAARDAGLAVTINAMIMNFPYSGDWGQSMLDAADTTLNQLRAAYPDRAEDQIRQSLGLTLMIGRNDLGMITTMADAQKVLDFAKTQNIGFLGFWSLSRDFGKCPGRAKASYDCSGVAQGDFDFTKTLQTFSTAA